MKYALSLALPLFSVLALTSADDGVAAEFEGTGLASFSSSSLRARQDVTIPHFCFQKGATCVT